MPEALVALASKLAPDQYFASLVERTAALRTAELNVKLAQDALDNSQAAKDLSAAKAAFNAAQKDVEEGMQAGIDLMDRLGLTSAEAADRRIRVTETPGAVEILDEAGLKTNFPKFFREKVTVAPDKKAIGDAIVRGELGAQYAVLRKEKKLKVSLLSE